MTKRYTGGVVSSSLPTVNAAGASGVFNLSQQADAQTKNNWPPFKVEKSVRFRSTSSAYLSRALSASSNRTTWTWSGWVKRGISGSGVQYLWNSRSSSNITGLYFNNDQLEFEYYNGSHNPYLLTAQYFRDPAAWYHIVATFDTTNATAADRMRLYINGTRVTSFSSSANPNQNLEGFINYSGYTHYIAQRNDSYGYFDGYLSEVNFIDGQALSAAAFGGTDKDGNWSPIAYTGTYGQNGFYLNFKDATSTSTIGYDYSGNGNNWSASALSFSNDTNYDSMYDVPSGQSGSSSSNVRGNYATLNPLSYPGLGSYLTRGNLSLSGQDQQWAMSTIGVNTGKWYWEVYVESNTYPAYLGVINAPFRKDNPDTSPNINSGTSYIGGLSSGSNGYYKDYTSGSSSAQSGLTQNATWGFALDVEAGTLAYYVAGTLVHTDTTLTSDGSVTYWPMVGQTYTASNSWTRSWFNFGQQPFAYTPPTGYKTLNTNNLPEPAIKQPNKHFDINLYQGTSSAQTITNNGGFEPSLVWTKGRSQIRHNALQNSVTGVGTGLHSNETAPDINYAGTGVSSFNSNGFSLGNDSDSNWSSSTYVAWQWKGAAANTTNTDGTITSLVRANPTAGFSVVGYTTQSSGTGTVGHGLGVAPSMIILKNRLLTNNWIVYHKSLGASAYLYLNTSAATQSDSSVFNGTNPTSSVFTMGSGEAGSLLTIAYCFSQIEGYSAFGSYTGNGSADGPFIYTGFRPKYLMIKCTSNAAVWYIWDSARDTYNYVSHELYANLSDAEYNNSAEVDFLSNGFKMRSTFADQNGSARTYIYAAFAEVPFKYSRSR